MSTRVGCGIRGTDAIYDPIQRVLKDLIGLCAPSPVARCNLRPDSEGTESPGELPNGSHQQADAIYDPIQRVLKALVSKAANTALIVMQSTTRFRGY